MILFQPVILPCLVIRARKKLIKTLHLQETSVRWSLLADFPEIVITLFTDRQQVWWLNEWGKAKMRFTTLPLQDGSEVWNQEISTLYSWNHFKKVCNLDFRLLSLWNRGSSWRHIYVKMCIWRIIWKGITSYLPAWGRWGKYGSMLLSTIFLWSEHSL